MQNVFHINEKETRKTLRFANSHARVAKRQFRAAYQNRKIRFVRPRSGDTNSAKPKRHLINAISTYGYRSIFEYITRKAPPKRGFSLKRKKYEKNTNKQYNIRSAVIRGDIFAEGQRNSLLFSVSDDRYGDRVPYLVAVNDRIVIRH